MYGTLLTHFDTLLHVVCNYGYWEASMGCCLEHSITTISCCQNWSNYTTYADCIRLKQWASFRVDSFTLAIGLFASHLDWICITVRTCVVCKDRGHLMLSCYLVCNGCCIFLPVCLFVCLHTGYCAGCRKPVIGIDSGCMALGNIYHLKCFTCSKCGESSISLFLLS